MRTLPWDTAPELPWRVLTGPLEQWANQPTFLVGEYVIVACALAALLHARHAGRAHLLIWFAALIAGTANDLIFMALPLVDNFWQAQATVMLTPRLPLYISFIYVVFLYWPTVAVRRLGLPRWSTAACTGLLACLFYAPYDIVGAKFLWWTWHDSDSVVAARLLGAPVSSSLWVLTFAGSFALLLDLLLRNRRTTRKLLVTGLALVAAFTTPIMVLQMTAVQTLDGGTPGYRALGFCVAVYAAMAFLGRRAVHQCRLPLDSLALGAVAVYLVMLAFNMAFFNPEAHVSTGLHQVPGQCDVGDMDITGVTRKVFLCVDEFDEDFTFDCTTNPEDGSRWYTICGKAHADYATYVGAVGSLALVGLVSFSLLFGALRHSLPLRRNHSA